MSATTKDPKDMNPTELIELWENQKLEHGEQNSSAHNLNSQRQDVETTATKYLPRIPHTPVSSGTTLPG